MHWTNDQLRGLLKRLVADGGPSPDEYVVLQSALQEIWSATDHQHPLRDAIINELAPTFAGTMQGFAYRKPRGYAGDFEMIERIYEQWQSPREELRRWDHFFHAQAAARAVRNRKGYFHRVLDSAEYSETQPLTVLNVGSGPCSDVREYFQGKRDASVVIDCVDVDAAAVAYAKSLCREFEDRVTIHQCNTFRFRPTRTYDLIWSGGMFDYFDARLFVVALRRLMSWLTDSGRVVIGNFSDHNATRPYMELVGQWFLHHRSAEELEELALRAGAAASSVRVEAEVEGVNLFLHASPA
ncbi:MAG TPA: hypothetical protein DCY79_16820 [Planctomycetaceae bacterium]|nr:hypothetical protein [Planctomycetaceae bacterium]